MTDTMMETHQLQSSNVLIIPQVPSEVQMVHKFENEAKRVFPSRIDPNERHEILVVVVEATVYQCFLVQPLRVTFSEQNSSW